MIHHLVIEQTGGVHGVRDVGALEAVLLRTRSGIENVEFYPELVTKAAVIMHSLIRFHPFADGNKRTGMTATLAFLESNGVDIVVEQRELEDFAVRVASEDVSVEQIVEWIESNIRRAG